ncbi:MAG: Fe3+-hydroxamate ABC transporter substrate-binding protein [Desulfobacterales bacterium]|nr:MAG: Fe3+-hydroxamate ABC transporter substrate-binding protein [Desulfobacterales bacterium]
MSIGSFSVNPLKNGCTEVRDGAGRTLILVPRRMEMPAGVDPAMVVRTPVKRVVAYSYFDIAILKALGVLEDVLVGVLTKTEDWYIPEVVQGMKSGKIKYLGDYTSIDFEQLRQAEPDLVLTWDLSILPMLAEMKVPCVISTTPVAMCLNARMKFVQFIAPFFNREDEAERYFGRLARTLDSIREQTKDAQYQPKVMWGDIYEKRVLVEPGNAWVGELVELALSKYQFEDVFGKSCIEISLERFLYSGQDAEILFTYRSPSNGATSKAALARANPLMAGINPLKPHGKVYSPLPHYSQSGDKLDEILTEISAILHPECYPGHQLSYFRALPDTDPEPDTDDKNGNSRS